MNNLMRVSAVLVFVGVQAPLLGLDYLSDHQLMMQAKKFRQTLMQYEESLPYFIRNKHERVREEASSPAAEHLPLRKINLVQVERVLIPMIFGSTIPNFPDGAYVYVWEYKELLRHWIRANVDSLDGGDIWLLLGVLQRGRGSERFSGEIVAEYLNARAGRIETATLLNLTNKDGHLVIPFLKRNKNFYTKEEALEIARQIQYVPQLPADEFARWVNKNVRVNPPYLSKSDCGDKSEKITGPINHP